MLGLLSAIGPFAIDMYLPALPAIGTSLHADIGAVQLSLTVFFLALAAGQPFYGPVSDMVGRKAPLYFGLVLFAIASVGCALADNIQTLIVLRFVQGLGAAAGMAGGAMAAWLEMGRLNVFWGAALGLLAALATMGGDLWESALKRRFGVKDAGDLIPGHGGLLDRVDGLMFAVVAVAAGRWLVLLLEAQV